MICTNPATRLRLAFLRALRRENDAKVLPKSADGDDKKVRKTKVSFKKQKERAANTEAGQFG